MSDTNNNIFDYWHWFLKGSGASPGFRRIINLWLIVHLAIGFIVAWLTQIQLRDSANSVLLPLVGILIGLTFAWVGNAQALLQSKEITDMANQHKGGFQEYVYAYQTAILAILITLVCWGLAGLGIFDLRWPTPSDCLAYYFVKTLLFALISLTLRECWQVVLSAQWMLLAQKEIQKRRPISEKPKASKSENK